MRAAGRRHNTLAALAKAGDPVAAVKDAELGRMLVLFPISEDLHRIAQGGADAASIEHKQRQKAEQLGKQLPFDEAIKLLESIDEPPSGLFGPACLEAFAAAVGRRAPTADAVLARLTAGPCRDLWEPGGENPPGHPTLCGPVKPLWIRRISRSRIHISGVKPMGWRAVA